MFNKSWFLKHQKLLLWFANTFIGRWILCINGNRSSVGKNRILKIEPNAITWKLKETKKRIHLQTEFRTHDKFSKRIKYAFYPLWLIIHTWDTLFANNYQPDWNLGIVIGDYSTCGTTKFATDIIVTVAGTYDGAGRFVTCLNYSYITCNPSFGITHSWIPEKNGLS